jgi:hypothetical protein
MRTTPGRPRHVGLLDDGPWLRDRTAVRIWGWISVLSVLVIIGALAAFPPPGAARSDLATLLLFVLFLGGLGVLFGLLGMIILWLHSRSIQYCPDCLKYMTRGACVCPYCGFRAEPAPAAPLGVTATPLRQGKRR